MSKSTSNQCSAAKVLTGLTAAAGAGVAAYLFAFRPWHRRWGATDAELSAAMPGDDLVPGANFASTRAITIDVPPEAVWPWLVQIGQGRGGFYSYDTLENLVDLDIHSADQILPQFQDLQMSDTIPLEPGGGAYTVAKIEPPRHLVLFTDGSGDSEFDKIFRTTQAASTWAFVLAQPQPGHTRLIVRWRARWDLCTSPTALLIGLMLEPIEFLMEQKMMRGIKQRAEQGG